MKKFLKIFISFFILGVIVYQFRSTLQVDFLLSWNNFTGLFIKNIPCAKPIPYVLNTFDTRFNISKSYFLSALTDAEAIWEKSLGKNLFSYTPTDSALDVLKINLIYDYRQQATSKLSSLGIIVNDDKVSYDNLKSKFTALNTEYKTEKSIYDAGIADFNQKQEAYNALSDRIQDIRFFQLPS